MAWQLKRPKAPSGGALLLALLAALPARAQSEACETEPAAAGQVHAAYAIDSDGDGATDDVDPCPADASGSKSTRDPSCYLQASWVPPHLAHQADSYGAFWTEAGCEPAMAFPVDDEQALQLGRGVVIVGAPAATARRVRASIEDTSRDPRERDTLTWNAAFATAASREEDAVAQEPALCIASFDYARSPAEVLALAAPALANFYVHFCPYDGCDGTKLAGEAWPPDGLGLARSRTIESWRVRRPTFAPVTSDIQRFAFSRGVLYARDLATRVLTGCSPDEARAAELADIAAYDPTAGRPRFARVVRCPDATQAAPGSMLPPGVTLLPPVLDRALREDGHARAAGVAGAPSCLLEGIPYGVIADVRAGTSGIESSRYRVQSSYLLATRGLLAATPELEPEFVVVPEAVGFLDQHLLFAPRPDLPGAFVVATRKPMGKAVLGTTSLAQPRRIAQRFEIEDDASRSVEPFESVRFDAPVWPPRADSTDMSIRYGTRWSSNEGPPDCWATTAFADITDPYLRFAYPVSRGGAGPIATVFCPNELDGWLARTRALRDDPSDLCKKALETSTKDARIQTVLESVSECLGKRAADAGVGEPGGADAGMSASLHACLRGGCNPLEPSTCPANPECAALFDRASSRSEDLMQCIASDGLRRSELLLKPSDHWADVLDGESSRLVAMVGLVRTTDVENEWTVVDAIGPSGEMLPSTVSRMAFGDAFFGGAHQTSDWNWYVLPAHVGAIDPAYRGMAVRRGQYVQLEHELEFGIARAMWQAHPHIAEGQRFNMHGHTRFSSFLQSDKTVERLGELWPTDLCRAFGINRGESEFSAAADGASTPAPRPSFPVAACSPCVSCDPERGPDLGCRQERSYHRTHFGRGIFTPITSQTATTGASDDPDASRMATDWSWPECTLGPAPEPEQDAIVPLGLEQWQACPHRISYLGRPIIDCGHGDDGCKPGLRLELHPTHLVSLELHARTFAEPGKTCEAAPPCSPAPELAGCTSGVVHAVFGWANVFAGKRMEFDLWPPPRPSPDSSLCVIGQDRDVSAGATRKAVVEDLGYSLLRPEQPPPCAERAGAAPPRLTCTPLPVNAPTHLHCVYEDPAAEYRGGVPCDLDHEDPMDADSTVAFKFGNPRMTPRYATSMFEARIFMGWSESPAACTAAKRGLP